MIMGGKCQHRSIVTRAHVSRQVEKSYATPSFEGGWAKESRPSSKSSSKLSSKSSSKSSKGPYVKKRQYTYTDEQLMDDPFEDNIRSPKHKKAKVRGAGRAQ